MCLEEDQDKETARRPQGRVEGRRKWGGEGGGTWLRVLAPTWLTRPPCDLIVSTSCRRRSSPSHQRGRSSASVGLVKQHFSTGGSWPKGGLLGFKIRFLLRKRNFKIYIHTFICKMFGICAAGHILVCSSYTNWGYQCYFCGINLMLCKKI